MTMTIGERVDALVYRVGGWAPFMAWGTAREEGYVRIAGLVIASERWTFEQMENAYELGRDAAEASLNRGWFRSRFVCARFQPEAAGSPKGPASVAPVDTPPCRGGRAVCPSARCWATQPGPANPYR